MDLETIDDFLYTKSKYTIDNYFLYLNYGLELIDIKSRDIPKKKNPLIEKYFGKKNIDYQVVCTTFINEVFHITESFLKSNLYRAGDYLIYPSMDKYPIHKLSLEKYNQDQHNEIQKVLAEHAKAVVKNKNDRIDSLSKKVGEALFIENKEILVNSISCKESLFRLEKYLNWTISDEVKQRFKLFVENRNEVIHFNKLTNLTFASSHSLFVLLHICKSNIELYPKLALIYDYLEPKLDFYNILIQEILFTTEMSKVLNRVKENAKSINNAISINLE